MNTGVTDIARIHFAKWYK